MDTFTNRKLNNRIEFPNVLDVRPYTKHEILKQARAAAGAPAQEESVQMMEQPVTKEENSKEDEPAQ